MVEVLGIIIDRCPKERLLLIKRVSNIYRMKGAF